MHWAGGGGGGRGGGFTAKLPVARAAHVCNLKFACEKRLYRFYREEISRAIIKMYRIPQPQP